VFHRQLILLVALWLVPHLAVADDPAQIRVGIIGLDTSHAINFPEIMNDPDSTGDLALCHVVAAYPQGSPDIESSVSRVPKYTAQIEEMGIEIVDSIDQLLTRVDAVLLETNDGRPHLEQALPCFRAGKRVFIDKPMAASLVDVLAIFTAAEKYEVPTFSSSSLRYGKTTQQVRHGSIGTVSECVGQSPVHLEKTHPDLYWYGIHGVESLFTVMGTGCVSVQRGTYDDGKIEVVGRWPNGRTGKFRQGQGYSGHAIGENGEATIGAYDGYAPLLVEVARFFRTGEVPVEPAETIELHAFMTAADESQRLGGAEVELDDLIRRARSQVPARLAEFEGE